MESGPGGRTRRRRRDDHGDAGVHDDNGGLGDTGAHHDDDDDERSGASRPARTRGAARSVQQQSPVSNSQSTPKRRRLAIASDDDDDEGGDTPTRNANDKDPHQDDNHDGEEELGADENARSHGARSSYQADNTGLGSIEKITLINFMCHSYLDVPMGPKINFIVGHNGSGKSAILTGLTVCLGAKASFTNRGTKISALLKEGEQVGSVTVRIRNRGPDAYNHRIYGDTIIVERRIPKEGAAGYKIKSASGSLVSTTHEELMAICDHMQIAVDNPMAILTQDTARTLLANSTPSEKYTFFLKGTQLEKLSSDYVAIDEFIDNSSRILKHKKQALPEMEQEVTRLQEKWKDMEAAAKLEEERNRTHSEFLWAKIAEFEQHVTEEERALETDSSKLTTVDPKIQECQNAHAAADEQVKQLNSQLEEINVQRAPLQDRRSELMTESRNHRQDYQQVEQDIRTSDGELKTFQQNIERLSARIEHEQRRLQSDQAGARRQRQERLEQLKIEIERMREHKQEMLSRRDAVEADLRQIGEHRERAQFDLDRERRALSQCDEDIRRTNAQRTNTLKMFHDRMPDIVRMIDDCSRRGQWRGCPPVGPIGAHITIDKPDYSDAIETLLVSSLSAMIVETHEDLLLLKDIATRCGFPQMANYRLTAREINFSGGEPSHNLLTVLRSIHVDHPKVLAGLVINFSIEKMVLVETRRQGDDLTCNGFPHNVSGVYSKDLYSMGNRFGGLSSTRMRRPPNAPRLSKNLDHVVEELRRNAHEIQQRISRIQAILEQMDADANAAQQRRIQLRGETGEIDQNISQIEVEIANLEERLREDDTNNLMSFEQEKAVQEESARVASNMLEAMRLRKAALRDAIAHAQMSIRAIDEEDKVLTDRSAQLTAEIETSMSALGKIQRHLDHWINKRQEYQDRINQRSERLTRMRDMLAQQEARCREFGDRVPVTMTSEALERKLKTLDARLIEKERQFGSREKLWTDLSTKKRSYDMALAETRQSEHFLRKLRKSLADRNATYADFKTYISIRAKSMFSELIRKRGYRGMLTLDHDNQQLHLKVDVAGETSHFSTNGNNVGGNASGSTGNEKDPRALSGGEKSFATVCLLLALWESMASPFRALDEFDVFMDAVNRRLAMKLMISNARDGMTPSQYILITPQNMSHVEGIGGPDVRVCRLSDPERGAGRQARLEFGA